MTISSNRVDLQIGWDKDNRRARKRSQSSEDGMALARINIGWLKSKAGMDTIAPCVDCGAVRGLRTLSDTSEHSFEGQHLTCWCATPALRW